MKTSQLMLGDLVMYYGRVSRIDGLWQDIAHIEGEPDAADLTILQTISKFNNYKQTKQNELHW